MKTSICFCFTISKPVWPRMFKEATTREFVSDIFDGVVWGFAVGVGLGTLGRVFAERMIAAGTFVGMFSVGI